MRYSFIDYSPHAIERFAPHDIGGDTIRNAIENPTSRYRSRGFPDRLIAEKDVASGPAIRIVYVERLDSRGLGAYVITVYPISRKRMRKG